MREKIENAITSWFGVGGLPGPTGTWGSLAALPFAWLIIELGGNTALFIASILCFFIGVVAVDGYVKRTQSQDPSYAVIDEVAGQWLTLCVLANFSFVGFILGFFLFRLFDIVKPSPCKQLEELPNGLGVMADDMAAGAYAAVILYFTQYIMSDIFIF